MKECDTAPVRMEGNLAAYQGGKPGDSHDCPLEAVRFHSKTHWMHYRAHPCVVECGILTGASSLRLCFDTPPAKYSNMCFLRMRSKTPLAHTKNSNSKYSKILLLWNPCPSFTVVPVANALIHVFWPPPLSGIQSGTTYWIYLSLLIDIISTIYFFLIN